MRLTKIKLAGFKSFVDPTLVSLPSNLTGIVGPNGCGKSNVIDAVRWVMGELSARHLRGDSMADVVFNGSSARKPVGTASVELIFDNADGKIGGPYASYNEVSLRRQVSRDGTSNYFINAVRCRRKDITQLFLGTGLGSRSYAIIEQGMISRIIESKPEDMRCFVEEAAGISRYKERRRETESRIGETRENLERLQDVRDEIDKQIRHLQRQAATARRYQNLKERERRLTAELLALRLRELDSGAQVHDSAVRARELAMQAQLAEQRAAEAALEKQRVFHAEQGERVAAVQGRYYEVGAQISRTEQSIQHIRELRERQKTDLTQARGTLNELALHIERDERELDHLRAELGELAPRVTRAASAETEHAACLAAAEHALQLWQARWEDFNRALGAAQQTTQVECARIEQLENQLQRLAAQTDRLAVEREALALQDAHAQLNALAQQEALARSSGEQLSAALSAALERTQTLRTEQLAVEARLDAARAERERLHAELLSLEALQQAAFSHGADSVAAWLAASDLGARPRAAAALEVAAGWERAVETALGDYLEAVCVEQLDEIGGALEGFAAGRLALIETGAPAGAAAQNTLAAKLTGPAPMVEQLARIFTAESLADALARRRTLPPGGSLMTPAGEWVGRDWLRVTRGQDPHAGVIEREQRLKQLRAQFQSAAERARAIEAHLLAVRQSLTEAEAERNAAQSGIQGAHRAHADLLGQVEAMRVRSQEASLRRARLDEEAAGVTSEIAATQQILARAQMELARGGAELAELDARQPQMHSDRDETREALAAARDAAQAAQLAARDLLIRSEALRTGESSMAVGLKRMAEQRAQLATRCTELESELAGGDAPILEFEGRLAEALARRLEVEAELASARGALEEADEALRSLDERRAAAEQRVFDARTAMEEARLAASATRVRRESIAEQFAVTHFALADIQAGLAPDATVLGWEDSLVAVRADIEKLGQVNLAAIDELKEQSERKEYLDRQFADLSEALATLEQAMRRIDKETRARFEETFERINAGLKEKFPRLFGGGHAYLQLVGEDVLAAGVAVMARPPGKRNSTIHLLSGGEKALTAVALVFSIFDLNPAPFCLLDEVDAPLDEHNVGRFCDIVREMSARIQFIIITHNKATMELAAQLIGVTMSEPGVSRLVSVDIDAALRLAAV
ncbi:MAG TPA: chromosome segregation protein SMC [Steroidobacteraceae bacterium]|jgi:chromosome segregation protein|nr:chromosome segregation protein SMC [Steroidobacteraceae bacterium]